MNTWFEDGRIVIVILMLIAGEFLLLLLWSRQRPGLLRRLAPTLAAGALLAMALGARHVAADWRIGASLLALAGLAHAIDIAQRLRQQDGR